MLNVSSVHLQTAREVCKKSQNCLKVVGKHSSVTVILRLPAADKFSSCLLNEHIIFCLLLELLC